MTSTDLHQLLQRLHEELGKAGPLDAESRELLGVVARDIGELSAPETDVAGHVPALERLAVRFESGHPAVSAALRQLVDALAKAGI
jgi:hypothetical protein